MVVSVLLFGRMLLGKYTHVFTSVLNGAHTMTVRSCSSPSLLCGSFETDIGSFKEVMRIEMDTLTGTSLFYNTTGGTYSKACQGAAKVDTRKC